MKKILFFNPPGEKLYIRDYYCSKVSQANYLSHPIDFVVMSSLFGENNNELFLVDSIVEKLNYQQSLKKVRQINPDVVVSLSGVVSWSEDKVILKLIKDELSCVILVIGDIFLENPTKFLEENNFIDGIITDFTSKQILNFLDDNFDDKIDGTVYRRNGKIICGNVSEERRSFDYKNMPAYKLFLSKKYRYPFTISRRYCSVLTEYGCPFNCVFCIMGKLKYKYRSVENVISELEYIGSLSVREIFFVDQAFGAKKERTKTLLHEMIRNKFEFRWFTFSRVDLVDYEVLSLMRTSGCHTIIFGIESGSEEILKKYRKGYNKKQIVETLRICRKLGIRTVGTFIIGLPDETEETAKETIDFISKLPLDYASFNVAVPRPATDLREEVVKDNLVGKDSFNMDQSGTEVAMPTKYLSQEKVKKIRQVLVRKFYLNPSYVINRLFKVRTAYEFYQNFTNAVLLIRQTWGL